MPQPSDWPARLPSAGQFGVQTQVPPTHLPFVPQPAAPQSQVSMQVPLLQTLPASHVTSAHRFVTQVPPLQTSPEAQVTPAQALGAEQPRLQAWPVPQVPLQALSAVHFPVPESQYWPLPQVTPAHGVAKQPETQFPFTHVWPLPQVTPAQGSVVGTQVAVQVEPPPHAIPLAVAQGSG